MIEPHLKIVSVKWVFARGIVLHFHCLWVIITIRKRSYVNGNVFSRVCLSTGEGVCDHTWTCSNLFTWENRRFAFDWKTFLCTSNSFNKPCAINLSVLIFHRPNCTHSELFLYLSPRTRVCVSVTFTGWIQMNLVITVHFIFVENYMKKRRKNSRALSLGFTVILIVVISVKRVSIRCQDDIFSRIELFLQTSCQVKG